MKRRYMIFLATALSLGCGANESVLRSGRESPTSPPTAEAKRSTFDEELFAVKQADFIFVYVLRRKDSAPLDAEDRSVIRANTADVNRRVAADEGRAFILGSNYLIAPENMTALRARFAIEDLSPRPAPESNANANK